MPPMPLWCQTGAATTAGAATTPCPLQIYAAPHTESQVTGFKVALALKKH